MKITGPGGPATPPIDPGGTDAPTPTSGEGSFVDKLSSKISAEATEKTGGPEGPPDPVATVAAELRQGSLSPRQAIDRLVDLATTQGKGTPFADHVLAKIRADLQDLLRNDPFLASKAKRLGVDDEK